MTNEKDKRRKGQFYTPTLFVDHAHKMISEQFGEDWKERFVVWDNCCGTKNLTRDYYFNELYSSTLENAELQIGERYNKEGVAFQFDFLNDSLDKLPQGLKDALEQNKPIIFFINPPYAKANGSSSTTGLASTKVNEEMLKEDMGISSTILYCQFLYRICKIKEQYNLTNCHIALFCKPTYLSGSNAMNFRKMFLSEFEYDKAILFNASVFADCSDRWGIHFVIYHNGETADKNDFIHTLVESNNGEIVETNKKIIYNLDGKSQASEIFNETKKRKKGVKTFTFSSALKIRSDIEKNVYDDAIGYINSPCNNQLKQNYVFLHSHSIADTGNKPIFDENFSDVMALFAARKLIQDNWINDKDEYLAPNTDNEHWNEFVNDSLVYSLFHSASNQSSLRQVEYKGKLWDIKNEFFFMPKNEVMELANENNLDFTYNDARVSNERYVYTKLQEIELSQEAKAVLDKAIELTKMSFKYRELFNDEHPEYQILNWDCGWYQIKGMLKEFMPNEYKEFNELYKALAEKMRPMVYELGFLK